ncbi:MAG: Fe2+-dependent dioxygenase [Myxococcota bacterium]
MAFLIDRVLDPPTVDAIVEVLEDPAILDDGKKTAGRSAREVKDNQQARADAPQVVTAVNLVQDALRKHPVFRTAALPLRFAKTMFSRYAPGMQYGPHVDDAFIGGTRTDLSFTLSLSAPDQYEGGELVLKRHDGDEQVKPPRGAVYLYPSNSLHYVAPVTHGVRLAAVGWVQSRVRRDDQREMLFDLARALEFLPRTEEHRETRLLLLKTRNNLLRLWASA